MAGSNEPDRRGYSIYEGYVVRRPMQGWSPNSRGAADQDTYGSVIRADTWHSSSTSSGQLRRMRRVPAELAGGARTGCVSHPSLRVIGEAAPSLRRLPDRWGSGRRPSYGCGGATAAHRAGGEGSPVCARAITSAATHCPSASPAVTSLRKWIPPQMRDSPACVARPRSGSSSDACQTAGSRPGVRHRRRAGLQRAVRAYAPWRGPRPHAPSVLAGRCSHDWSHVAAVRSSRRSSVTHGSAGVTGGSACWRTPSDSIDTTHVIDHLRDRRKVIVAAGAAVEQDQRHAVPAGNGP